MKDGRWRARLPVRENGVRKRVVRYAKTQGEARRILNRMRAELDDGGVVATRRPTVRDFLNDWLTTTAKPSLRYRTFKSYEEIVRLHLIPILGHLRLDELRPEHVQRLMEVRRAAGLSPRRIA